MRWRKLEESLSFVGWLRVSFRWGEASFEERESWEVRESLEGRMQSGGRESLEPRASLEGE